MKHGFLLIDKPAGPTSHDIVSTVRRTLHEKKVGHLGTLDPAASGLIVLAVGAKALKVVEFFNALSKEYIAEVELGSVSSTFDRDGAIEAVARKPGVADPTEEQIIQLLKQHFTGQVSQVPPAHSAVHIDGNRAYVLARQGKEVDMPTRTVDITACELLSYSYPHLTLRVGCSSGTYIRSIAHDLGERLRVGGYLAGLRRTKVGEWSVDFAVPPEEIGWSFVVPLKESLIALPSIEISDSEAEDLRHGRNIKREVKPDTFAWHNDLPFAVLVPAKDGSQKAHARKVL